MSDGLNEESGASGSRGSDPGSLEAEMDACLQPLSELPEAWAYVQQIQAAEEQYRHIFECSQDALMTLMSPDWRFTKANPAALRMFRARDAAHFESEAPWNFSPARQPDGRPSEEAAQEAITIAICEGAHSFEWTHRRFDGEVFPATVVLTSMAMDGKIGLLATVRDVTEQRAAEAQVNRLAQVVEQSREYVVITDVDGSIEYVNPAFEAVTGYSREEALGENPRLLKSGLHSEVFYRDMWATLNDGLPWMGRLTNRRKSGEVYLADVTISPLVSSAGEVIAFAATSREVTELVSLEQQLRATFEQGFMAMGHLSVDGRIVRVNDCFAALLGVDDPRELYDRPMSEFIYGDDLPGCACAVARLRSGENPTFQRETRLLNGSAEPVWVEIFVTLVQRTDGSPGFLTVVCHDISHRKRMELELMHAQKLESIGQLAAGIAHEINTPTQYVSDNTTFLESGFSKLLQVVDDYEALLTRVDGGERLSAAEVKAAKRRLRKAKLPFLRAQIPEAIEQSLDGLDRISKIVGAMKDFSHPSRGEKRAIDLNRAIEATVRISRNEWKFVATVDLELDASLPLVPAIADELNQVFLNILVNAAHAIADKHAPGDLGTITIRTYLEGERAVVAIRDTGAGMPPAVQARIFDPFFTTKEVGKGTGQGLSIAHSIIVDKHGGRIQLDSTPGEGTEFRLLLPLTEDRARAEEGAS